MPHGIYGSQQRARRLRSGLVSENKLVSEITMLDAQFIRDNLDAVKTNCRNRNVQVDVDRVLTLDDERRKFVQSMQVLQQRQNEIAKLIPKEKDKDKKQALIQEGRDLRQQVADLEAQLAAVEKDLNALLRTIPNMTHPDAPVGTTGADNKVIKTWGEPRKFDFKPRDHVALAESLQAGRFRGRGRGRRAEVLFPQERGRAARTGPGPVCHADACSSPATRRSSRRTWPAVDVLEGIGFLPRDPETQIYSLDDTDLCLIATAEITLGGMHRDQIFDELDLPIKYVGLSHCFRTEAGAPGRDTRGLYRVHQFTKVEMFAFSTPDQSEAIHQELLGIEESIFQGLGLPYQVIDTCTGDLGGPAYRKYDLEAWMPGRGEKGEYGEVTSTSNCTDYQSRRLNIRYKGPGHKGTQLVHTLNGTAVAITRALVAILENYQQADGSVVIPEVLRPWVQKEKITRAVKV